MDECGAGGVRGLASGARLVRGGEPVTKLRLGRVAFGLVLGLMACDGGPVEVPENDSELGPLDPVVVRTAELWDAVQGHEYVHSLLAEGGTGQFQWHVTDGALPDGLSLTPETGAISGVPGATGDWSFTVEASSGSAEPGRKALSIVVHPEPMLLTDSMPSGEVGMSYSAVLRASGGDGGPRWGVMEGALPAGLVLDERGVGIVSGVPEEAGSFQVPFMLDLGTVELVQVLDLDIVPTRPPPAPWPGAEPWRGHRRDGGHTGYVPVTLDPSRFTVRWRHHLSIRTEAPWGEIVSTDGVALLVDGKYGGWLIAFDLASGTRLWEQRGGSGGWGWPGTANGLVYVTTAESPGSELLQIDVESGEVGFAVPFGNQFYRYRSPIVRDGAVVTGGGRHGGVMAYAEGDGARLWFEEVDRTNTIPDAYAPAVADSVVYSAWRHALRGYDLRTGEVKFEIPGACDCAYDPIIAASDRILVRAEGGGLAAMDPTAGSVAWHHPTSGSGVTDGELVYLVTEVGIEVLDVRTGSVVDRWEPPHGPFDVSGLVLTDNLLFLAFDGQIHAVETDSWTEVWHHPGSGFISLSEGMLLMHGDDKQVTAIELGPSG